MFIGLQLSRSRGGCYCTGRILFPSVLGKTVISGISFRFMYKTQHNALETKAPKTLQLNSYPVQPGRIKKDPIFLLLLFLSLHLLSQEMHLSKVPRQTLGQPVCAVVGACRKEKVRQVLQEDTHGSISLHSRVHAEGQGTEEECQVRKEKEKKEIREEGMDGMCPGTNLLSSTQKHNAGCYCPRGICLLLLLPAQIKGLRSDVQIPLQGHVQATQRWFLLLCC